AALLSPVSWVVAIPAALIGLAFGVGTADTSKQVAEFRKNYCDKIDAHLDALKPLLTAEFNARMEELKGALESRIRAIRTLPPPAQELTLRRELDALLQQAANVAASRPNSSGRSQSQENGRTT